MSLLAEYDRRTAWKYEPVQGYFHTAPGLENKVSPDGKYVPFAGSTVVFALKEKERGVIQKLQDELRNRLESTGMLADPLPVDTAHMTLHDLVSPEKCVSEPWDREGYEREVTDSFIRACDAVRQIREEFAGRSMMVTADRVVNMVSKSLVLLLRPVTEEDYVLLLALYSRFEDIVHLPYPLTPHITLAYFRPGMLDGDRLFRAMESVQAYTEEAPVFEMDIGSLKAQWFYDMQRYTDVPEQNDKM